MRAARLLVLALAMVLLVGCLDLDQVLEIHADGTVDLRWRLGLNAALAHGPWGKSDKERHDEWQAMVPPEARDFVKATVEDGPETIWLVIDAHLPDVSTYAEFRDAFIGRYEDRYDANPMLYPPEITRAGLRYVVDLAVPPKEGAEELPVVKDSPSRWQLRVHAWTPPVVEDADRVDADGALIWDRPIAQVLRDGLTAHAEVPIAHAGLYRMIGIGAILSLVLGGALALGRSRTRPPAQGQSSQPRPS